jgi:hypothetical protein
LIDTVEISECAMNAADTRRVWITLPVEVKNWAQERARYHQATLSAEVVRSLRERMEREAAKDRSAAAAPE